MSELRGLWRRKSIVPPDRNGGEGSRVYWLQTDSLYADVRIPSGRRQFDHVPGLAAVDGDGLRDLAGYEGFAGRASVQDSVCTWQRTLDWQPDTGMADVGRLTPDGDDLLEEGIIRQYREVWQRTTPEGELALGLELRDDADGRAGILVCVGNHFIYARGRAAHLPQASHLSSLLHGPADRDSNLALFDAEFSLGSIEGWRIVLSTLPWREGDRLFEDSLLPSTDAIGISERSIDGKQFRRRWQVVSREDSRPMGAKADMSPSRHLEN